ncbi:MAG TPA: hypothetical protein VF821_11835 [Lentzea sp.]
MRCRGWRSEAAVSTLHVWPADGFLVNFFDWVGDEVCFDVDTRELQGRSASTCWPSSCES